MGCSPHAGRAGSAREMGQPPDDAEAPSGDDRSMADEDRSNVVTRLIEVGRDREAAARTGRLEAAPANGGPMDTLTQLDQLGGRCSAASSAGITPDQLDRPDAVRDYTVRGVLEHMIGGATAFAAAFRGETPAEPDLERSARELRARARRPRRRDQRAGRPRPDRRRAVRRGRRRRVRPLRRPRRAGPRLGHGDRHRPALRPAGGARGRGRRVRPPGARPPARRRRPSPTPSSPPAGATPIERLAAYTGRQPLRGALTMTTTDAHPRRPRGDQGEAAGHLGLRRLRRHRHHAADRRRVAVRGGRRGRRLAGARRGRRQRQRLARRRPSRVRRHRDRLRRHAARPGPPAGRGRRAARWRRGWPTPRPCRSTTRASTPCCRPSA